MRRIRSFRVIDFVRGKWVHGTLFEFWYRREWGISIFVSSQLWFPRINRICSLFKTPMWREFFEGLSKTEENRDSKKLSSLDKDNPIW